jgi:hypothetical protein
MTAGATGGSEVASHSEGTAAHPAAPAVAGQGAAGTTVAAGPSSCRFPDTLSRASGATVAAIAKGADIAAIAAIAAFKTITPIPAVANRAGHARARGTRCA